MKIERYTPAHAAEWDAFVDGARNGSFLFRRGYMDYHADRFADHSLLARDEKERLVALLPGHAEEKETYASHRGLTYGGFVVGDAIRSAAMLDLLEATRAHLRAAGFAQLFYKCVPAPYHRAPAEEDRYALFAAGAQLVSRHIVAAVDRRFPLPYQDRRARGVKKARAAGFAVRETDDFAACWRLLTELLETRHAAAPVHSLDEIQLLAERFPKNIRLFGAYEADALLAAVLVYDNPTVARAQYICAGDRGRDLGALDLLFATLLEETFAEKPWFEFGTSDTDAGRTLNRGLIAQKEGFGARAVVQDHYLLEL